MRSWAQDPYAVAFVAAALHVLDETGWGLIPEMEARQAINDIISARGKTAPAFQENSSLLHSVCMAVIADVRASGC
jgi:hypothetical protein